MGELNELLLEYFIHNREGPEGDTARIKVKLELTPNGIAIGFEGYGEKVMPEDLGKPVFIELYKGTPRVIVFGDINNEEATHIVSLDNTSERLRGVGLAVINEHAILKVNTGGGRDPSSESNQGAF